MKRLNVEFAVGLFVLVGLLCLGYLAIKLGRMEIIGEKGYEIYALFSNTGGIKTGSSVVLAGVEVGRVKSISLENYQAKIVLTLQPEVKIQEDAIASIKTKGLVGEKYIEIIPGGSEQFIPPGGRIRETQPPVDLEDLISKILFEKI
ncbi:MAG: outer membrane lipid asymmetry maintenance protein MlaD [Thermodesulfobacteriota bacterium]